MSRFEKLSNAARSIRQTVLPKKAAVTFEVASISPKRILTKSRLKRISPTDLERLYHLDGLIFNGINLIVHYTVTNFKIECDDPKSKEVIENFVKQSNLHLKMEEIIRHECIYGNFYGELNYNKPKSNIVDITVMDPKTIDFKRDSKGVIELIDNRIPTGYVQKVGIDKREFKFDEIAHFRLYTVADSWNGIGLIEPQYKICLIKLNLEEALGESAWRYSSPTILAQIGDGERRETWPTPEAIQNFSKELRNFDYKTDLVVPYFYNIKFLQPGTLTNMRNHMEYFINLQCATLGVPRAILLGAAEGANRATVEIQAKQFAKKIKSIQAHLAHDIEEQIFRRIIELRGLSEVPRIVWDEIEAETLTEKAERYGLYAKTGLLTPDDNIEKVIRESEGLPPKEELRELAKLEDNRFIDTEDLDKKVASELDRVFGNMKRKSLNLFKK